MQKTRLLRVCLMHASDVMLHTETSTWSVTSKALFPHTFPHGCFIFWFKHERIFEKAWEVVNRKKWTAPALLNKSCFLINIPQHHPVHKHTFSTRAKLYVNNVASVDQSRFIKLLQCKFIPLLNSFMDSLVHTFYKYINTDTRFSGFAFQNTKWLIDYMETNKIWLEINKLLFNHLTTKCHRVEKSWTKEPLQLRGKPQCFTKLHFTITSAKELCGFLLSVPWFGSMKVCGNGKR